MSEEALYELKYTLPHHRGEALVSFLGSMLEADPKHPFGTVCSIYFDTEDLLTLSQKISSDYIKTKLRLRWYVDEYGMPQSEHAFVEIKNRTGTRRQKVHADSAFSAQWLQSCSLEDPALQVFLSEVFEASGLSPSPLMPVIELHYTRRRYIDPRNGARAAFDSNIHVAKIHPRFFASKNPLELPLSVFEYKGEVPLLPSYLTPVTSLGGRKESFSKYLACYEHCISW